MSRATRRAALLLPLATAGCSLFDSWFGENKVPLDGRRESISTVRRGLVVDAAETRQMALPPPVSVPEWPQPGGGPTHMVGHVAVAGFAPAWRSSIGEGGGYRAKITAQPLIAAGRVFAMDSDGLVSAFNLDTGGRAWRTDTQGDEDRSTNVGGGVSYAGGTVYASTGRAELLALDSGSGAIRWRKPLGAPARSAPTVADGRLFVQTLDDRVQAFSAADGERQWGYQAATSSTTLLGQAAPAYAEGLVVCGFGSGDLVAVRAESGALAWSDSLASGAGAEQLARSVGDPGVAGVGFRAGVRDRGGGLLVSLDLRSGRRLWEREVGGLQTPWVVGDWVFVQTAEETLAAVGRDDGRVRWLSDLPRYDNPEKRRDPLFWTGPVLAGKLILAGSNGFAFSVDPLTGTVIGKAELRDAAAVAPVAAAGTLLFVSDDGTLRHFDDEGRPMSTLPVVVIAGRPNVGKSTLFNKLAGRRHALVSDTPGVTRDRKEAEALLRGKRVRLIDTAGLEEAAPESLPGRMRASSETAVGQADLVVFVVDVRTGITPADEHFAAAWLRRQGRPVLLVANKAEGRSGAAAALEAYSLGLGEPLAMSAEHGEGLSDLMTEIADRVAGGDEEEGERPLKLAIVGRPNAGKSTLLNRLLGEERMITGPEPGLTRDAVAVRLRDGVGEIELVDTAGLRKKARVELALEKMSVSASIEALKMAEVVVLCLDAVEGLHEQDLQIGRLIEREGRACVLALNKWDAVADRGAAKRAVVERLESGMAQMKGLPVVTLSGLTGAGVERLLPAVRAAHEVWNKRVGTGALNRWFEDALERHAPPLVGGRRLKLRYMTQAKARPPTFVAFGTRAEQMPDDYQRYLVNGMREEFGLPGVPIRLLLRGTENPFAEGRG